VATDYDAILLVSFGGPEGPDEVIGFMENVTRGRDIPRQRLEEVSQHYLEFGGRSPINDQNRALKAALEKLLAEEGPDLPVYFGNRNWHPLLADTLREMRDDRIDGPCASSPRPTRPTRAAGSTGRTWPPLARRSVKGLPNWTRCASITTIRVSSSPRST
jgi:protoheme ferro-lyase